MNYEDTLFVLPVSVYITQRGGIITRPLLESDGVCVQELRYQLEDGTGYRHYTARTFNSSISDECRFAGLSPLPHFKEDGYYRFYDDCEQVVESWKRLIRWMKQAHLQLNKKDYKKVYAQWQNLIQRTPYPGWEKMKASTIGMPVKRRADLGPLARDMADRRDFVEVDR